MKKQPKPANTKVARDPDGRWKKGTPSPNPKGRAPEGESWGSVFKHVFSMTPEEAAQYSGEIGKRLKQYGAKKITLKELIAYRLADALLFEPQASLLNAVMDRAEGKLAQTVNVSWREEIVQLIMEGRLTREEVTEELGDDLATELFVGAGVPLAAGGAVTAAGE